MPEIILKGKQPLNDTFVQHVSGRAYGDILADTTALSNIKVANRQHGMIAIVAPSAFWCFDKNSSASASGTVVVPATGSGRWLKST